MKSAVESLSWLLRAVSFKDLKMHLLPSDSSLYFHSCSPKQGSFYYPVWKIDAFELWCWRRLLIVPWTAKRSNQPILKEINPEYSLEGLMLKLKLPILWPPDLKSQLIGKDPDARKDWRHKEKGATGDEMVGWHHLLNGHEFEQAPGVDEGQGSLACCSPWGCKELDTTERLNWTEEYWSG